MTTEPGNVSDARRYLAVHRAGEATTPALEQLFGDAVARLQRYPRARIRHLALEVDDNIGTASTSLVVYFDE